MMSYRMIRYTLIAPDVRQDNGEPSGYADSIRRGLERAGVTGWTEYKTVGVWKGKSEPGTLFEIYRLQEDHSPVLFARHLGIIGRRYMADQEAVQVTYEPNPTMVLEY